MRAKEIVTAKGINILPSSPVKLKIGKKTTIIINTPLITGVATSTVARYTICSLLTPLGARFNWVWMFSTTTTAASTKIPIAMANPPKVIKLADTPVKRIMIKVNSTANGKIMATVNAALRLPSMIINTNNTKITASASAFSTVKTAADTNSLRS